MFKADGSRRDFPLKKNRVIVGRTGSCDLRIPLSSVSRRHCELVSESDGVRLRDLGSSNGTYHNNTRITEILLQPGDEVGIGPVVFTVVIDGQPSEITPVKTIVKTQTGEAEGEEEEEATASHPPRGEPLDIPMEASDTSGASSVALNEEQFTPTVNLEDSAISGAQTEGGLNLGSSDDSAAYDGLPSFGDDDLPMLPDEDD
jgi:pSer/pThr/pTyr-binding forkhead associated (FHA) protein